MFFESQSVDALCAAIKRLEQLGGFDPQACRSRAAEFSPETFRRRILQQLQEWYPELRTKEEAASSQMAQA